jgi:hypothetical protein
MLKDHNSGQTIWFGRWSYTYVVDDSTIKKKWKFLFLKGWEFKSPIRTVTDVYNSRQLGKIRINVLRNYVEKYDSALAQMIKPYVAITTSSNLTVYNPENLT